MATGSAVNSIFNWSARVLAVLYLAILVVGWLDESAAREEPRVDGSSADWFFQWAIWTHVAPIVIAVISLVVGWRWQLWGASGFGLLTILSGISAGSEWAYLPFVAGPPAVIAVFFLVAWRPATKSIPGLSAESPAASPPSAGSAPLR